MGRAAELDGQPARRGRHRRHRFAANSIQTWWRVLPDKHRKAHDVEVLVPSTGADVVVTATLRDGQPVALAGAATLRLADIAWLHVGGAASVAT